MNWRHWSGVRRRGGNRRCRRRGDNRRWRRNYGSDSLRSGRSWRHWNVGSCRGDRSGNKLRPLDGLFPFGGCHRHSRNGADRRWRSLRRDSLWHSRFLLSSVLRGFFPLHGNTRSCSGWRSRRRRRNFLFRHGGNRRRSSGRFLRSLFDDLLLDWFFGGCDGLGRLRKCCHRSLGRCRRANLWLGSRGLYIGLDIRADSQLASGSCYE